MQHAPAPSIRLREAPSAYERARLARELGAKGTPTQNHESLDAILALLTARARPGDVIALLSNGAFGGIHAKLLSALG